MSYTESRARYAEVLDSVANDREEVVITRAGHEPVVIVSLEDYESLRETAYLMRSPANARRLLDAMERLEAGRGEPRDLVESLWWQAQDRRVLKRVNALLSDIQRKRQRRHRQA
jgi:antitoxin YefM